LGADRVHRRRPFLTFPLVLGIYGFSNSFTPSMDAGSETRESPGAPLIAVSAPRPAGAPGI